MIELRRRFLDALIEYSFIAQNKMIDKIYEENGIPMSDLGQKIIAEVRRVAAERPDYVYPSQYGCSYLNDCGGPSCLVGHALWNRNLIRDGWEGDSWGDSSIHNVIIQEGWQLEIGEIDWLSRVQDAQDSGYSWGHAIARADKGLRFEVDDDEDV